MAKQCMLTTIDNPFNPFTEFKDWFLFDCEKGYNSCSYLARIARTSDALTEEEQAKLSDKVVAKLVAAEEALASLKTPSKSNDGNQTGLIIGISGAAVVVIAGVVVFVLKKKKSK